MSLVHYVGVLVLTLTQVIEDYPKLDKVLAVFYEALRLFRKPQPKSLGWLLC